MTCPTCSKTFKNLALHITKAHTYFTIEIVGNIEDGEFNIYANDEKLECMGGFVDDYIQYEYDYNHHIYDGINMILTFENDMMYFKLEYLKRLKDGSFKETPISDHRIRIREITSSSQ